MILIWMGWSSRPWSAALTLNRRILCKFHIYEKHLTQEGTFQKHYPLWNLIWKNNLSSHIYQTNDTKCTCINWSIYVLHSYFRKSRLYGLACYEKMSVESEIERGARMKSVGILSTSYTLLYRHIQFLESQVR